MTNDTAMPAKPSSPQRALRSDAARNHAIVLAAARQAFAEEGLGVGFSEIARRAGVGVGTVYRRFPHRDALIEALFEDRFQSVAVLAEKCLASDDAWVGIEGFVVESVRMFSEDRGLREITFDQESKSVAVAQQRSRLAPLLQGVVTVGHDAGVLRIDCGPEDLAAIIAMLSDITIRHEELRREVPRGALPRIMGFVLDGIKPPSEGRRAS